MTTRLRQTDTGRVRTAAGIVRHHDPLASQARIRLVCCVADETWRSAFGQSITGLRWRWAPFAPSPADPVDITWWTAPPASPGGRDLSQQQRRLLGELANRYRGEPLVVLAAAARSAVEAASTLGTRSL